MGILDKINEDRKNGASASQTSSTAQNAQGKSSSTKSSILDRINADRASKKTARKPVQPVLTVSGLPTTPYSGLQAKDADWLPQGPNSKWVPGSPYKIDPTENATPKTPAEYMQTASQSFGNIKKAGGTNDDWYNEMLRRNEEAKKAEEDALKEFQKIESMYAGGAWDENGNYTGEHAAVTEGRKAYDAAKQQRAYSDYVLKLAENQRYEDIDEDLEGMGEMYAGQRAYGAWKAQNDKENSEAKAEDLYMSGLMASDNPGSAMYTQAVASMSHDESWWQPSENWTSDERRQFYVLFNRDMNEAKAYGEKINNYHNAEKASAQQKKAEEWATQNGFTGAVATVGALAGGATALADVMANSAEYAARGTVTQKSYLTPADYSNVWTAAIASNLNEQDNAFNNALAKLEPVFGEVGVGDIYQIGYNVLQNLTYGNILGPAGAATAYFGIGAKSGYEDAAARGASPAKAFLMGVTSGGIEYLTEKYSLDNLVNIKSPVTLSSMIKAALIQGGIEMSEEELSMLGSTLADAWIMGDQSALRVAEEEYMLKGYSATDSKKMALRDWWKEAAYTALSSMASGFGSGGIQAVSQNVTRYKGDSQALIDKAMLAPEGSEARMTAEKYQQALDRLNTHKEKPAAKPKAEAKSENKPKAKTESKFASLTPSAEFAQQQNVNTEGGGYVAGKAREKTTAKPKEPKHRELTNAQAARLQELTIDSIHDEVKSRFEAAGIENAAAEKAVAKLITGEEVSKNDYKALIGQPRALAIAEEIQADRMNGIQWDNNSTETEDAAAKAINKNAVIEINGEQESIEGIQYTGNKLEIKTASGWHPAASVSLPAEVQQLIRAFSPYKDSAGAMFRMYEAGQDPVKFAEAWAAAENMYGANTNAEYTQARNAFNPSDLTDGQLYVAFNKGRDRRNAAESKTAQNPAQEAYTDRTGSVSYDGGIVDGVKYKAVDKSKLTKSQKRQIAVVEKLAKALKINFVLYESELVNGRYTGASGIYTANTVYLDVNAGLMRASDKYGFGKVSILRTAAHELTHYLQANNLEGYNKLKDFLLTHITEYKNKNINDLLLQKQERAERAGNPISADEAMDEIVADGCEMMLKDTQLISKLANEDRTLAEQIKDWFSNFSAEIAKAFAGIREEHEEARAMAEYAKELQQLWEDELVKAAKSKGSTDTGTRNSYAGERAKTANKLDLSAAIVMEESLGKDSEYIRKDTGWFRGYDGRWRFEVDDSAIKLKLAGNITGEIDGKPVLYRIKARLEEVLDHPALFAAYPQLKDMTVRFTNLGPRANGRYVGLTKTIELNSTKLDEEEEIKKNLMHEIQHAVQAIEGFTRGASPDYWRSRIKEGFDPRTAETKKKLADAKAALAEIKEVQPEFYAAMTELEKKTPTVPRGVITNWDTLEAEPDPPEWVSFDAERDAIEAVYGDMAVWDFMDLTYKISQYEGDPGRSPVELYYSTAGEIEARDVAKRLKLTAKERKNTRPDIDQTDVVFSDKANATISYSEDYIKAPVDSRIIELLEKIKRGDFDPTEKIYFHTISEEHAKQIFKETGVRVDGFKVGVEARQLEHILADHGKTGAANRSMKDPEDIAKMGFTLSHPDDIRLSGTTRAYVEYRNGRNHPAKTVLYEKEIGAKSYYVVQAVADTKKKTLHVVTAFIGPKGYKKEALQSTNAKSPGATPENESANASELSVLANNKNVKSPKSFERYENKETLESRRQDLLHRQQTSSVQQFRYQARDILPDERDLLLAEAAKRGASRDLKRYRAKYREVERLHARLTELEERQRAGEDMSEEIAKTETSAERAENKLRELEASAPIQSAMETALAEWRSSNDAEAARVLRQLNEENERLRERVEYYKEEMRLSENGRQRADASDVRAMAENLVKEYGSKVDRKYLAEQLQELADYIVSNGNEEGIDSHTLVRASRKIAANLVNNIYIRESSNEDAYNELRSYLQGVALKISDELRGEAPEGIKRLRNQYFGRLRLEKEGMDIDSAYMELQGMFGEGLFPNDITAHLDQIEHIGEVLDELAPREVNPLSKTERLELGAFLANNIVDELMSDRIRQRSTLADRRLARAVSRAQSLNEELERIKYEEVNKRKELVQAKVTELRNKSIERDKAYKATQRIKQKINRLYKALKENSGKNHVPQEFKESVAAFLGAIDTLNKHTKDKGRAEYERMVTDLEMVVAKMQLARGEENADIEIPEILRTKLGNYLDFFETAANSEELGAVRLSAMSSEELKIVEDILSLINKAITEDTDQRLAVEKGKISALAEKDIEKLEELGKKGLHSKTEDFFRFSNLQPVFYFKRLGEGATEIFHQIQKGWARFAFRAQEIIDFAEKTYDGKLAKNAEETIVELELYRRLPDDPNNPEALRSETREKVKVTKAQLMSLYALSQRKSALTHLLGAGIRIGNIKQGGKTLEQAAKYLLSMNELTEITNTHLSDEDRRVVDALVRFMSNTGSEWGNEVSMKRYGIKMFEEENYFPMKTDDTSRDARDPAADSTNLFRLASQGFTKALRPNSKNALVLDSVFDVFANHMVDMAKYNTLALPAIDAMRFWNYRTKTGESETGQITSKELRTAVEEAFGSGAINYFTLFMKDLNGNREGGRGEDAFSKLTSRFKIASIGANLRVWQLQYSSIVRAGAVLDPKIIAQNSGLTGKALKQAKEEMQRISGDARWKKLGFRDIAINANVRELIKQNQTTMDKLGEMSMKLAELADERVWAILWESCKQEVREKQGLTGDALLAATEERFQEVIYRTQVMDSTLTKSQLMRDKGNQYTQMITSFMSEPTLSYNMLLDAYNELQDESRKTSWGEAWQAKQGIVKRCLVTYVATSAAAAIFGSIANALRDDDEYESFAEKFLEAFKGNFLDELNPLAKIPIVKDIVSMAQGYGVERSDMTSIAQAYKALQIWEETIKIALGLQEEATDITYKGRMTAWGKIFETLKAVSQLSGLPISSLTRDTVAIYNTLVGIRADMPIKTYDAGKASNIKWAYKDGYLSAEEAAAELLAEGIEDTEEDARWTVLGWDSGAGKYDALEAALLAKDAEAYAAAVEELVAKGATMSGIESQTQSIIKEAYQNKEKGEQLISKQEAIDLLVNQNGMRRKNAEALVQKWTSYVVDGIQYDDIDDAYIAGDISHDDAVEMRMLYGGYTEAEAEETVLQWQCKKDTGIAYGDIKDEFLDGGISLEEAVAMRVKYGGVDEEKAAATVLQWQCEKDTGIPYENIQQFYDASEIGAEEVIEMLMTYGGLDEADARGKLAKFDFMDGDYSMNDITFTAVGKYNEFVKQTGMSTNSFYEYWKAINAIDSDRDAAGEIVTNAQVKRWAYIDSLNISRAQKDAMHLSFYSARSLSKAPWN